MTVWTLRLDQAPLPDRGLVGGKAWSIAHMLSMGLNVPPAFVVTTQACNAYLASGDFPPGLIQELDAGLAWLEQRTGRTFGGGAAPLLLSVRSGAAVSMPGMMDTVLNLGIDAAAERALARESGLPDFARDTHRRFHELYAAIVLKAPVDRLDPDGDPAAWRQAIRTAGGGDMPPGARDQLLGAIRAVFDSWNTRRAKRYRQHNGIADDLGTAVTVQAMVFGNLDAASGTGVLFSRNPLTGERAPFGEYLPRAQGEDVVSGKFTPLPLEAMAQMAPAAHAQLLAASALLEHENADAQDIEFTVQRGELYLLQARSAKRSPEAAARMAVDMVADGLIDEAAALTRISAEQARAMLFPRLAQGAAESARVLLTGEGACPGVAAGVAVADPDEAERRAADGEDVILIRPTTSPDDIHGMIAARAIVTAQGGATSHAAVVSRALGRPCVVGAGQTLMTLLGQTITVDGAGVVYAGRLAMEVPDEQANPYLARLIDWARARSPIAVLTPAEAPAGLIALDLDHHLDAGDPSRLDAALFGQLAARGDYLSTPEGARAAHARGVRTLVTSPLLPALLAIAAAETEANGS
jgi:pyruvate,orthophosphate dikinase